MPGAALFSVEVELAWGYHDKDESDRYAKLSGDRRAETKTLETLLRCCERYDVPLTFDIVGHLLLDSCDGDHDLPHDSQWFAADPGTDREIDPLFYAPDLVEQIQSSSVDHELATHTYSHVLGEEHSDEVVTADLAAAQAVHESQLGSTAESLVAPRHHSVSVESLREAGIGVCRRPVGELPAGKAWRALWYFSRRHPVRAPAVRDGIVETYTSQVPSMTAPYFPIGQAEAHPVFRAIPASIRRASQRRYYCSALDRAVSTDQHAHFWTHLHNMANPTQTELATALIREVASRRETDGLSVLRMCDLPDVV
jgi:peptidoglycan/xylan/chitin deacetylase (PgdA/CDA1 family)